MIYMTMKIGDRIVFDIKCEKMLKKSVFLNLKMTLSIIFMIRFVISALTYSSAPIDSKIGVFRFSEVYPYFFTKFDPPIKIIFIQITSTSNES